MKKSLIYSITVTLFLCASYHSSLGQVNTVAVSDLDSVMGVEAKPVLMLLSTEWCKYCQIQKHQLKKNKDINSGQDDFYYVEFDAELKDSIVFNGKNYAYKSTGLSTGIHELTLALNSTKEEISFPRWVLLDSNYQLLYQHNGVLASRQLGEILKALHTMNKATVVSR